MAGEARQRVCEDIRRALPSQPERVCGREPVKEDKAPRQGSRCIERRLTGRGRDQSQLTLPQVALCSVARRSVSSKSHPPQKLGLFPMGEVNDGTTLPLEIGGSGSAGERMT